MNNLQSRYTRHVKDVYGVDKATIPQVAQTEIATLIESISNQVQPLLLRYAMQRKLEEYRAIEGEHAELILWDKQRRLNVSSEVAYLGNLSKDIDKKIKPSVKRLTESLGLDEVVNVKSNEELNLNILRKLLRTAYWLNRNMGKVKVK